MDNFVKDQFLPTIRSNYRTRVADALMSEGMRPIEEAVHFFSLASGAFPYYLKSNNQPHAAKAQATTLSRPHWHLPCSLTCASLRCALQVSLFCPLPADASAFRPKAKTVGVYEGTLAAGRPVLSGPLAVEAVAHEVLAWAVALPVYAGELVGLVHTLLERTLERCKTVLTEVRAADTIGEPSSLL